MIIIKEMRSIFGKVLAFALLGVSQLTFAETCPSIQDIKHNMLSGWQLLDSEEGTPLNAKREALFKKNAKEFVLAEWPNKNNKHGIIHCYYRDQDGSGFEAYLAKNNFAPQNNLQYWYAVTGAMQCAAGKDKCEFNSNATQLASR